MESSTLVAWGNGTLHKSHQPLDVNQLVIWAKEQWLTAAVIPPELPAASIWVQWTRPLRVHSHTNWWKRLCALCVVVNCFRFLSGLQYASRTPSARTAHFCFSSVIKEKHLINWQIKIEINPKYFTLVHFCLFGAVTVSVRHERSGAQDRKHFGTNLASFLCSGRRNAVYLYIQSMG